MQVSLVSPGVTNADRKKAIKYQINIKACDEQALEISGNELLFDIDSVIIRYESEQYRKQYFRKAKG